jgi:hypothetical protein
VTGHEVDEVELAIEQRSASDRFSVVGLGAQREEPGARVEDDVDALPIIRVVDDGTAVVRGDGGSGALMGRAGPGWRALRLLTDHAKGALCPPFKGCSVPCELPRRDDSHVFATDPKRSADRVNGELELSLGSPPVDVSFDLAVPSEISDGD